MIQAARRRILRIPLAVLLLGSSLWAQPLLADRDSVATLEYKVKAGYLYNFAKLVRWPGEAPPTPDRTFVIGVLGGNGVLSLIESLLQGRTVDGRLVQVRAAGLEDSLSGNQILFVTRGSGVDPETLAKALDGSPTLLVGEVDGFARHGGIINFVVRKGRVKFEANPDAARRSQINLGSQLLKLADLVTDISAHSED